MTKLTKLEILNETIAYYNGDVNRRSVDSEDDCYYNGENGNHCAIGRCMIDELKNKGVTLKGNRGGFENLAIQNNMTCDEVLEERYRGHEMEFWIELQELHDDSQYWDNAGLNAKGEQYTNEICKTFNLIPVANA